MSCLMYNDIMPKKNPTRQGNYDAKSTNPDKLGTYFSGRYILAPWRLLVVLYSKIFPHTVVD